MVRDKATWKCSLPKFIPNCSLVFGGENSSFLLPEVIYDISLWEKVLKYPMLESWQGFENGRF